MTTLGLPCRTLAGFLDVLQTALAGSPELDKRLGCVLTGRALSGEGRDAASRWRNCEIECSLTMPSPKVRWSEDLTALLRLIPPDYNFSLGERDGVVWAWIQPNDQWMPAAHEMRHDHPQGSGLIVACTLPLALAAALVVLRALPECPADRFAWGGVEAGDVLRSGQDWGKLPVQT